MPSQIQQRHLLHLAGEAFGAHQAIGEIMFTGGIAASLCASYIHGRNDNILAGDPQEPPLILWHYFSVFPGFLNLEYNISCPASTILSGLTTIILAGFS
jgi:hypothetical protein